MESACIIPLSNQLRFVSDEQVQQLNQRVLQLRKAAGMTQKDISQALGISSARYSHYERGFRRFPVAILPQLAEALGCTEADLFNSEQPKSRKRGPTSRLDLIVNRIYQLPRTKQAMILDMVEGALDKAS